MDMEKLTKFVVVVFTTLLALQAPQADTERERIGVVGVTQAEAHHDLVILRLRAEGWIDGAEDAEQLLSAGFVVSDRAVVKTFHLRGDDYGNTAAMLHLAMFRPDRVLALGRRAGDQVSAALGAPVAVLDTPDSIVIAD